VYTLATLNLGVQTGMGFFTVLGGIFVAVLACLWLTVSFRTLAGGYRGHLFVAPCLGTGNVKSRETAPANFDEARVTVTTSLCVFNPGHF
jgi:hypothetical protein